MKKFCILKLNAWNDELSSFIYKLALDIAEGHIHYMQGDNVVHPVCLVPWICWNNLNNLIAMNSTTHTHSILTGIYDVPAALGLFQNMEQNILYSTSPPDLCVLSTSYVYGAKDQTYTTLDINMFTYIYSYTNTSVGILYSHDMKLSINDSLLKVDQLFDQLQFPKQIPVYNIYILVTITNGFSLKSNYIEALVHNLDTLQDHFFRCFKQYWPQVNVHMIIGGHVLIDCEDSTFTTLYKKFCMFFEIGVENLSSIKNRFYI